MTKYEEYTKKKKELTLLSSAIINDSSLPIQVRIDVFEEEALHEDYIHHAKNKSLRTILDYYSEDRNKLETIYLSSAIDSYTESLHYVFIDKCEVVSGLLEEMKIKNICDRRTVVTEKTLERYERMLYNIIIKEGVKSFELDW